MPSQVVSALSAEYEACEHSDYVRIPDAELALFCSFCDLSCCSFDMIGHAERCLAMQIERAQGIDEYASGATAAGVDTRVPAH